MREGGGIPVDCVQSNFSSSFISYIGHSYWVRDGCSAIIVVKHVKTVFVKVLSCSTQCSAGAWIVALFWKLPQMPTCSTNINNTNLDKNNLDMILQNLLLCSYPWPNMNEQITKLKVLGKSVGLCKTVKRKDQLYIRLLVSVLRIICGNFNPNWFLLARLLNENINNENKKNSGLGKHYM